MLSKFKSDFYTNCSVADRVIAIGVVGSLLLNNCLKISIKLLEASKMQSYHFTKTLIQMILSPCTLLRAPFISKPIKLIQKLGFDLCCTRL
jgi:hypothetical protein